MAVLEEYFWICVVGGLAMFMTGFGIGANDVANNFGSAIGGRTISLGKAILLAGICEFIGAVVMGASVTNAIRGDIIDLNAFANSPDIMMYGNLCALIGAGMWLLIASFFGMPVSTTHSIVGALIGFGVASGQSGAVKWKGLISIIGSWFISPVLALIIAMSLFAFFRWAILRRPNPIRMGYRILWIIIFAIVFVFSAFLTFSNPLSLSFECLQSSKDGPRMQEPCKIADFAKTNFGIGILMAFILSLVLSAIVIPVAYWYTRRHLRKDAQKMNRVCSPRISNLGSNANIVDVKELNICSTEDRESKENSDDFGEALNQGFGEVLDQKEYKSPSTTTTEIPSSVDLDQNLYVSCGSKMKSTWKNMPWNQDIHADDDNDSVAMRLNDGVETFDPKAEAFFSSCQVMTACCLSMSHGANDVANGTGPYAAIIALYLYGSAGGKVEVPFWIMVLGGASIAIGLAVMGHKVIKTIGVRMIKVTPARGVVSDIATTLTVVIFSQLRVPLSSTHCKVGSNLGVGLIDKSTDPESKTFCGLNPSAVNWKLFGQIVFCWVATLAFAGTVSAALFSFGVYGPTLQSGYYTYHGPGAVTEEAAEVIKESANLFFGY